MTRRIAIIAVTIALAACREPGPASVIDPKNTVIVVQAGDGQYGTAGGSLAEPLQVVVYDQRQHEPAKGVSVRWRITAGSGATLQPETSITDSAGAATTMLRLGSALGTYTVEASFQGLVASPAVLTLHAVAIPSIASLSTTRANAGDTIAINGANFSSRIEDNTVTLAGVRAAVVTATATQLRVVVPQCVPSGTAQVVAALGAVWSAPAPLQLTASTAIPALNLAPGQATTITAASALSCIRLPGTPAAATYLLVAQNATDIAGRNMPMELMSVGEGSIPAAAIELPIASNTAQDAWDAVLRGREQDLRAPETANMRIQAAEAPPQVGDRRDFNVIDKNSTFTKVTAVVRAISDHAILYEDINTPAGTFATDDYAMLGRTFDDPIYSTDVAVFGSPSDIDQNGKIIVLFTPVVNQLTPANASSFIAAFFYGCDLVDVNSCKGTNRSEMFYSLVPDPTGQFGMRHTTDQVVKTVQPVLAHEFQHMIHFNERVLTRKAATQESLWLAEGLAHTAEDTVGGVYAARGDASTAFTFRMLNYGRALRFLLSTSHSSLIAFVPPGTLEERGAQWLFIRYLMGRFGGDVLRKLTQTTATSTANVAQQTQVSWSSLINDWSVATYLDDRPDMRGVAVESRYTYGNFDLYAVLSQPAVAGSSGFPLKPRTFAFGPFDITDNVVASSAVYALIQAGVSGRTLNLSMALPGGGAFPADLHAQLSIVRLR